MSKKHVPGATPPYGVVAAQVVLGSQPYRGRDGALLRLVPLGPDYYISTLTPVVGVAAEIVRSVRMALLRPKPKRQPSATVGSPWDRAALIVGDRLQQLQKTLVRNWGVRIEGPAYGKVEPPLNYEASLRQAILQMAEAVQDGMQWYHTGKMGPFPQPVYLVLKDAAACMKRTIRKQRRLLGDGLVAPGIVEVSRDQPTPLEPLGYRNYRVGDRVQAVEPIEDAVLTAFARGAGRRPKWVALDQKQLRDRSGYETAPRVLNALAAKYQGVFAPAIDCPGKRGQGGLKVYVQKPRTKA